MLPYLTPFGYIGIRTGSRNMNKKQTDRYGNPYPFETATVELGNGLEGEVGRALFEKARIPRSVFRVRVGRKFRIEI